MNDLFEKYEQVQKLIADISKELQQIAQDKDDFTKDTVKYTIRDTDKTIVYLGKVINYVEKR